LASERNSERSAATIAAIFESVSIVGWTPVMAVVGRRVVVQNSSSS
jgi:hypothetical protein